MSRLTERLSDGEVVVAGCGRDCKYDYGYCDNEMCSFQCPTLTELLNKLAYYEDLESGMTHKEG